MARPPQYSRQQRSAASTSQEKAPTAPDQARNVVHKALAHQAELFPDLDLAPLDTAERDPRDAAFAHAIYDAVLRRWMTLEYLVSGYLSRSFSDLDPRLQGVLLAGAAQMLLLERVPPHAALNESVEWAKKTVKPAAGGLVNAVLRKIAGLVHGEQAGLPSTVARSPWTGARDEVPLGDGTAVKLRAAVLPENRIQRIAVATSHPVDLIRRWAGLWSEDEAIRLAAHSLVSPPTVLNVRFSKGPIPETSPHDLPGQAVSKTSRAALISLLDSRPDIWAQDAASALAVASVADLKPRLIVDTCAGQGTKTRQLAATFPDARVIASDVDRRRLATLKQLGRGNPRIEVIDPSQLAELKTKADLVLLDVPCSNTGVLPRRVEAKYRRGGDQLARLVAIQRQILTDAASLLAPSGTILYSTCSLEPEENEGQVAWAERELAMSASRVQRTMPKGAPGDPATAYHDGAFSATLRRRAD